VSNLAICVTGLPAGARVTQLPVADAGALTGLVAAMELAFFGRSEANEPEIRGSLSASELHGTRGTAGIWQDDQLVAAALAFDDLAHGRGLSLDLFIHPAIGPRQHVADRLLDAAERYAALLDDCARAWLKSENFGGDDEVGSVFAARGYEQHRTYLRMRIDFEEVPEPPPPLPGLTVRTFEEADWPEMHRVITQGFADHYDFHPLPFEAFRRDNTTETSDRSRWRLVFDGPTCVAVSIGSNRFATSKVGYVENLTVLPAYRRRGVARMLLRDAFALDARNGFTSTTLHCDATNPTGANQLYTQLGMRPDQSYSAWRARMAGRFAPVVGD
jgi:GNAT superfamily N-acetyltransferase